MRPSLFLVALFALVAVLGCQATGAKRAPKTVVKESTPSTVTVAVINSKVVPFDKEFKTSEVLRFPDVEGSGRKWKILVGPNPGGGPATVRFKNAEPDIYVQDGWIYVFGSGSATGSGGDSDTDWGAARTKRVSGTVPGTNMLVQEQKGVHRVFLLSPPPHKVKVVLDDDPGQAGWLKLEGHYFQVGDKDKQLPPPGSLANAPADVTALVKHVQSLAAVAGVR